MILHKTKRNIIYKGTKSDTNIMIYESKINNRFALKPLYLNDIEKMCFII